MHVGNVWFSSLTFEFDLQHLIDVLNDVSVGAERVARAVNADLQAEVGLWAVEQHRFGIRFLHKHSTHGMLAHMTLANLSE